MRLNTRSYRRRYGACHLTLPRQRPKVKRNALTAFDKLQFKQEHEEEDVW